MDSLIDVLIKALAPLGWFATFRFYAGVLPEHGARTRGVVKHEALNCASTGRSCPYFWRVVTPTKY